MSAIIGAFTNLSINEISSQEKDSCIITNKTTYVRHYDRNSMVSKLWMISAANEAIRVIHTICHQFASVNSYTHLLLVT